MVLCQIKCYMYTVAAFEPVNPEFPVFEQNKTPF